jgi:hypothetical protein
MFRMLAFLLLGVVFAGVLSGCASTPGGPPVVAVVENPVFVQGKNHEMIWEQLVDVVDDYFDIAKEEPVRVIGDTIVRGRIATLPLTGATVFDQLWRPDGVTAYERWEATLQSIRRYALISVSPTDGGYFVDLQVFKEMEDVAQTEHATAGAATFRHDTSVERYSDALHSAPPTVGWIPLGRDIAVEQKMLAEIKARLCSSPGVPVGVPIGGSAFP